MKTINLALIIGLPVMAIALIAGMSQRNSMPCFVSGKVQSDKVFAVSDTANNQANFKTDFLTLK